MPLEHHPLHREFPEYRTALLNLLSNDGHFSRLAAEYEDLDKRIFEVEDGHANLDDMLLLGLKMQRVSLKDELADLLRASS
jgi:uncharacterized protein YdcH (DUF465 family)